MAGRGERQDNGFRKNELLKITLSLTENNSVPLL